jgi:hypothetical protein
MGKQLTGRGWFVGQIDDVQIFDDIMDPSEVGAMVAAPQLFVTSQSLVAYYDFETVRSGSVVPDSSGSGHDGLVFGSPKWVSGKVGSGAFESDSWGWDWGSCPTTISYSRVLMETQSLDGEEAQPDPGSYGNYKLQLDVPADAIPGETVGVASYARGNAIVHETGLFIEHYIDNNIHRLNAAVIYSVNGSGEIRSFTGAASGANPMEGSAFTNGTLEATVASYGSYLGFTQVPGGAVYGVNTLGGVDRWSSIGSWLAGDAAIVESSGVYGAGGIHGCSYDGNTGGFYVVYEGNGVDGDIGEYATLSDFINNVNATVSAAGYGGNINNWWCPATDSGGISRYYQSAGNGNLEGFQTLADYIADPANRTEYTAAGGFSGVGAVFSAMVGMSAPAELSPPTDPSTAATASENGRPAKRPTGNQLLPLVFSCPSGVEVYPVKYCS